MKPTVIFVLLLAIACGQSSGSDVKIVDEIGESLEKIGSTVCKIKSGVNKQLARPLTISNLARYLRETNPKCYNQYEDSFEDLIELINTGNSDPCGETKFQMIADYHRKFISTALKHQKEKKPIPKLVKLFFLQYATHISTECEHDARLMLQEAAKLVNEEEFNLDEIVNSFAHSMGINLNPTYDDIFLIWNLIELLPLEGRGKFGQSLQSGPEKVFLQMKDPDNIVRIQGICQNRLKPLYQNSILSIINLVDLGYYPKSENWLRKINSDPAAKRLYLATLFCETILPVQMVRNEQMEANDISIVPLEEAKKIPQRLVARLEPQEIVDNGRYRNLYDINAIIRPENAGKLAKAIKHQVSSRGRVIKKALFSLISIIRKQLLTSSKKLVGLDDIKKAVENFDASKVVVDAADEDHDEADSQDHLVAKRESKFITILRIPFDIVYGIIWFIFWLLIEKPYQLAFGKRLIPVQGVDMHGKYKSYAIGQEARKKERKEMIEKIEAEEAKMWPPRL